jgi:sigma-B regulation protein RsbU (phosphoserine phosphatase)
MRTLLSKLLNANGYVSYVVSNGQAALDMLDQKDINLIITDLNMPGLNGEQLCRAIRAKNFGRYIYIIMITAQTGDQSLVNAMQAGADDYISKPLNPVELKARLSASVRVLELEASLKAHNQQLSAVLDEITLAQEEAKLTLLEALPAPGKIGGISFNWLFCASSFIGGDTFDYFFVGENHVCFYIVDVSGHGVIAAMQAFAIHNDMQSSKAGLQSKIDENRPLTEILCEFATDYSFHFYNKKRNDSYFTMILGLFDIKNGEVALLQAGHPPAIYLASLSDDAQLIGDGGLPVGIVDCAQYDVKSIQMTIGARLCLYSDGVSECENELAEMFGQERLVSLFLKQRNLTPKEVLLTIEDGLKQWRNGSLPNDDVTCLILEYHGNDS